MAYPIFPTPASRFTGTIDYPANAELCKEMYSYLNSVEALPKDALNRLTPLMQCIRYNAPNDLNNSSRWQDDIKSAYYLLYQYV